MRIAMVSEHASPLARVGGEDAGGQNVHVAALARALGAAGDEVVVFTRRDDATLPRRVPLAPGVAVEHVDAGPPTRLAKDELLAHMPHFTRALHDAWSAEPPDVVHSHFWMSGWSTIAAARPLGIPVAHTFHALGAVKRRHQPAEDSSPLERDAIEEAILRRADRVIATCTDEVRELGALGDVSHVAVVPCGVDLAKFWCEGPAEPQRRRHRLAVIGRLVPRKGAADVIAAMSRLGPDVELVIAGGCTAAGFGRDLEAERLRALAAELGVADRVDLRGPVTRDALPVLMRSADLVVCAPWYEPFGIVPLEAMGCGVPVVATAVGGMLDTVVDGVTGALVPPRDPETLALTVQSLLDDPERRASMGTAATRRARLYSWRRIAAATRRVYDDLAVRRALPAKVLA